jgi:hypothetical protein
VIEQTDAIAAGHAFEKLFCQMAKDRGFAVYRPRSVVLYDAVVQGKKVQCKNKMSPSRRVMLRKGKPYKQSDFDVLALNVAGRLLLIPVAKLLNDYGTVMTDLHDVYRFISYENKWSVFNSLGTEQLTQPEQMSLFEGEL